MVGQGKVLGAGCVSAGAAAWSSPFLRQTQECRRRHGHSRDALFLVASPTKPVVMTAVLMLVERGDVALEDRRPPIVPAFAGKGKDEVQVRHLMTHTSRPARHAARQRGLRRAHTPLSAFIEATCPSCAFPPGTQVGYQSMGTRCSAEIVHQVSGKTIPEFLRQEIFEPLGMNDTSLGWHAEEGAVARWSLRAREGEQRLGLEQPLLARPGRAVGRPDHVAGRLGALLPDDARRRQLDGCASSARRRCGR